MHHLSTYANYPAVKSTSAASEQFEHMWTTEKDDYCLVESDSEMGYTIRTTDSISMVLIEDGPLAQETIKQMLNAGCLVFDNSSE